MDDTIRITAPGGIILTANPLTGAQMTAFALLRGAETELVLEIASTLFKRAFGDFTYRQFVTRMAKDDSDATLETMVLLLGKVIAASIERQKNADAPNGAVL